MIFFNGVDLRTKVDKVNDVRRDILPPRSLSTITLNAKDGELFGRVRHEARIIEVDVTITAITRQELRTKIRELAVVLRTDSPVELILSDEVALSYQAILSGDSRLVEKSRIAKGTLIFVCLDPYAYGIEKTSNFVNGELSLVNDGNAPSFPRFESIFTARSTYLSYVSPNGIILIGDPDTPDKIKVPKEELVFTDNCADVSLWSAATIPVADGEVSGTMQSNGTAFYASSYGVGSKWHGPAIKRSLPAPVTDFIVEARIALHTSAFKEMGRVEIYLLDANNVMIGKMAMKDVWHVQKNHGEMVGGGSKRHYMVNTSGGHPTISRNTAWNDFTGVVRLKRIGKKWQAYIAKVDANGRHYASISAYATLSEPTYADIENDLAQIVVHVGSYSNELTPYTANINDIKVWKVNTITTVDIPEIIEAGDMIEVDNSKGEILKNGEPWMQHLDIGTTFFSIPAGTAQTIQALSSDPNMTTTAYLKERWI
jgi:predicted phage tail component-like protein